MESSCGYQFVMLSYFSSVWRISIYSFSFRRLTPTPSLMKCSGAAAARRGWEHRLLRPPHLRSMSTRSSTRHLVTQSRTKRNYHQITSSRIYSFPSKLLLPFLMWSNIGFWVSWAFCLKGGCRFCYFEFRYVGASIDWYRVLNLSWSSATNIWAWFDVSLIIADR